MQVLAHHLSTFIVSILTLWALTFSLPSFVNALTITKPSKLTITNTVGAYFELPPSVAHSYANQISITTGFTHICSTFSPFLTTPTHLTQAECIPYSTADIYQLNPDQLTNTSDWRRNYNGVFTMHLINTNNQTRLVSIKHGENKNEKHNNQLYQNTVFPEFPASECYSGYNSNGEFVDCFKAYQAFVNLSWQEFTASKTYGTLDPIDIGPIVWPVPGYRQNNTKISHGVRHPHGFQDNGYLYVFYNEMSASSNGIKVARAPITNLNPESFQTYCNGTWNRSLPNGFDKTRMTDFYSIPGGCSSPILPPSTSKGSVSFAVTKTTTGSYLGIEETLDNNMISKLNLYHSKNLLDWIFVKTISESNYKDNLMHYPKFLNLLGNTNELVDYNAFHIIGASGGNVHIQTVSNLDLQPLPGDLNTDGKVDIFDYQRLISQFSNPYTIFDYQKIIANFGT